MARIALLVGCDLRLWEYLVRALRLRCPQCGKGRLFRTPLSMFDHCVYCGLQYAREEGYLLGSIYFNYGLTALIVSVGYPLLVFGFDLPSQIVLWSTMAFCIIFPLWFFRYARSLWIAFDQLCDPEKPHGKNSNGPSDRRQR